jgi:hypothetical protein
MGARQRALAFLVTLTVVAVGTALLVVHRTGGDTLAGRAPGSRVAAATADQPRLFDGELLVWAVGGFTPREVQLVAGSSRVAAISAVRAGLLGVAGGRAGQVVPVEAMAVDRSAFGDAVGPAGGRLDELLGRGAVLSRTGAALRHLAEGDRLRLADGRTLPVAGVVDDGLLGGYEVGLSLDRGAALGVTHVAYLLLQPRGPRGELERTLGRLLAGRPLGFRQGGRRGLLRGGEAVLPLADVKARFGEFAVPSLSRVQPDPAWVAANIASQQVPLLGEVRCHRLVLPALAAAMADLQRLRLAPLVDVGDFHRRGGCYAPRPPRGEPGRVSRHSWGIAIDLNVGRNPPGAKPDADPRLVRVMARHGFTWGGRWLHPEGAHFEWVGGGA